MKKQMYFLKVTVLALLVSSLSFAQEAPDFDLSDDVAQATEKLMKKHGKENAERIERGVKHIANIWFEEDGSGNEFQEFCMKQFIPEGNELDHAFEIAEMQFEAIRGHQRELSISLDFPVVVKTRPVTELDRLFSNTSMNVDYYENRSEEAHV